MAIRFGTSGWRAIIADEFTFAGVRAVTRAICKHLRAGDATNGGTIIVGYDTRFLGERFAAESVKEIAAQGFRALLCNHPTPTPTISHAIRSERAVGGINFTASHNPPEYNGMKFSTADGAPALPEITRHVEQLISEIQASPEQTQAGSGESKSESYDPRPAYLDDLASKIRFEEIARVGGRYAFDPLWGTGRGYLDEVLRRHDVEIETIHDWRDVMFGGRAPEPDSSHLDELREVVSKNSCALGLATDGDGDRFGVIDGNGRFITPNQLIALLFDYLAETRGWTGGVARSVATSHLVDRVAEARSLPVYETPVGFKFIGELINEDKIILGGEESAGMSIKGHYPEKDGILACLLAAEAVAARGASLSEQLAALYERVGRLESGRIGVRLTPELVASLPEKLKQEPTEIGGQRVERVNRMDGVKFIFADGSWLLMRPSGTEPVVRIYAESESDQNLEELLEHGRKYILG
ncbi:MAG: phosphoglucomutase/phosphomannomutase family protein [Acidobacteria bacterium]|nr:phosphoglucomutase/phosphomannomutase family protein [Acidobacteriota bacterium]